MHPMRRPTVFTRLPTNLVSRPTDIFCRPTTSVRRPTELYCENTVWKGRNRKRLRPSIRFARRYSFKPGLTSARTVPVGSRSDSMTVGVAARCNTRGGCRIRIPSGLRPACARFRLYNRSSWADKGPGPRQDRPLGMRRLGTHCGKKQHPASAHCSLAIRWVASYIWSQPACNQSTKEAYEQDTYYRAGARLDGL
jgi:hypothetical protein